MILLERQPVGGQPVIIEMGKVPFGAFGIIDSHTARNEKVNLFIKRFWGFLEFQDQPPKKVTPIGAQILRDALGVLFRYFRLNDI